MKQKKLKTLLNIKDLEKDSDKCFSPFHSVSMLGDFSSKWRMG